MTIQLELWQLITAVGSVSGAVICAFWALATMIVRHANKTLEAQFAAINEHLARQDGKVESIQRELSSHRIELARDYVRREDYTRDIASIMIKIDSLALRVENKLLELFQDYKGGGQ